MMKMLPICLSSFVAREGDATADRAEGRDEEQRIGANAGFVEALIVVADGFLPLSTIELASPV